MDLFLPLFLCHPPATIGERPKAESLARGLRIWIVINRMLTFTSLWIVHGTSFHHEYRHGLHGTASQNSEVYDREILGIFGSQERLGIYSILHFLFLQKSSFIRSAAGIWCIDQNTCMCLFFKHVCKQSDNYISSCLFYVCVPYSGYGVCVCTRMRTCARVHVHICGELMEDICINMCGDQRLMLVVFFNCSPPYIGS